MHSCPLASAPPSLFTRYWPACLLPACCSPAGGCHEAVLTPHHGLFPFALLQATFDDSKGEDACAKRHSTVGEALAVSRRMSAAFTVFTHLSQRCDSLRCGSVEASLPSPAVKWLPLAHSVSAVGIPSFRWSTLLMAPDGCASRSMAWRCPYSPQHCVHCATSLCLPSRRHYSARGEVQ